MKIYIAAHKHMKLHTNQPYQPLFVGAFRCPEANRRDGWQYDDTGVDDISYKNATFCELTGVNWILHNNESDITGLVHYRRYFRSSTECNEPLSEQEIRTALSKHDCIVAQRTFCTSKLDGYLCSAAEQYRTCHSSTDLTQLDRVIKRYFRSYHPAFRLCMKRDYLHPFNMLICRKELFDEYCRWLFEVESRLEERIDPYLDRDDYQKRVFGFLAERLMNVYLEAKGIDVVEYPIFDPIHPDDSSVLPLKKPPFVRSDVGLSYPTIQPVYEGIDYSKVFEYRFYLTHNEDLAKAYSDNPQESLQHFIVHGAREKRMAHPCFSVASYMQGHPELKPEYGDDPLAYVSHYLSTPSERNHATGYENLQTPSLEKREALSSERTCTGKRINKKRLSRYIAKAEKLPVLD